MSTIARIDIDKLKAELPALVVELLRRCVVTDGNAPAAAPSTSPASGGATKKKGEVIAVRAGKGGTYNVTVDGTGSCRSCSAAILWCETPKGKKMPVTAKAMDDGTFVAHFSDCPNASDYRGSQ